MLWFLKTTAQTCEIENGIETTCCIIVCIECILQVIKKEKKDSLSSEQGNGNGEPHHDSNQYLDLGLDSYGFPNTTPRANGGINQEGYT